MADEHPAIRQQANMDGHPEKADINVDAFTSYQQFRAVLHPPRQRMDALNQLDAQLSREDCTLRQRSQLMDVRRRLSRTHELLLKAGR
jgi:hypothetical protein